MLQIDILYKVFNNKALKIFIPRVNQTITAFRKKKIVTTYFDKSINRYMHTEGNKVILVDVKPAWTITYNKLLTNVTDICCKLYIPKSGDIVVDVGAGVGEETLIFADLVKPEGQVYAIEAHPETAFSLAKMCQLNNYLNVKVSQLAVGSKNGQIFIENRKKHDANKITESEFSKIKVTMITIDNYIKENRIKRIDFVKMNIEGAEEYVIQGMTYSIKIIRNIAIGCHDFLEQNNNGRIKNKVIQFLKVNNFVVKNFQCSHVVRANWVYGTKS